MDLQRWFEGVSPCESRNIFHVGHVGLLTGICVERRRGVGSVCGVHKKRVNANCGANFCFLKDALLAGLRMSSVVGVTWSRQWPATGASERSAGPPSAPSPEFIAASA